MSRSLRRMAYDLRSRYNPCTNVLRLDGVKSKLFYAREGVDLDRSTLAGWVGAASQLLTPRVDEIKKHVLAAAKIHADDTPVPVLAPGNGKTKTGRLWAYVRDDRPAGCSTAPAVWFAYSEDRKGEHPRRRLKDFKGALHVSLTRKSITLSLTKAGRTRPVPLNSIALDAFKSLKASGAASGPVFLYADGNPVHTPRGWFETAIEKAEIEDYPWHCNRRTFASRLVMEGVDIRTVAQLMGHSTIQMTMRYSHLAPEHSQTAVERLVPSGQLVTKSVTTRKRQKAVRQ